MGGWWSSSRSVRSAESAELDQLRMENNRLEKEIRNRESTITLIESQLQEKTKSFSAYLSSHLSGDERYLENIAEAVRPSSLGERYQQLESTEWASAKDQIDDNHSIDSDRQAREILCFLMDDAYTAARHEVIKRERELLNMLLTPVENQLLSPDGSNDILDHQYTSESEGGVPPAISQMLKNEILKCMKQASHLIDLSGLEEHVKEKTAKTFSLPEGFFVSHNKVQKYLKACCRLAWQFHLVQPPMVVSTEPNTYDENIHELSFDSYSSDDDADSEIQYYIWPILYNYEGGPIAAKGRVMLGEGQLAGSRATRV